MGRFSRPRYSQADQSPEITEARLRELDRQARRNQWEWPYPGDNRGLGLQRPASPMCFLQKAIVTVAIGPATAYTNGNTNASVFWIQPGSGAVQFLYKNSPGTDGINLILDTDSDGAGNSSIPCLNAYTNSNTINTNTVCWVVPADSAVWFFASDCNSFVVNTNGNFNANG
jgi:hypothetical protein